MVRSCEIRTQANFLHLVMHLSIVCPTLLPPDIGASCRGLVSQICDPGVRHVCIHVSQKNDLGVGHGTSLGYGKNSDVRKTTPI